MKIDTTTTRLQRRSPEAFAPFQKAGWPTTQLDRVREAGQRAVNPGQARAAWSELLRIYWYPVYGFIRARRPQQEAADLTQEFFTRQLAGTGIERFDPSKGRFRSYLLGAVKRFLSSNRQYERREKRDRRREEYFDPIAAEERFLGEGKQLLDPERLFIRRTTWCLLDDIRCELRKSQRDSIRAERYDRIEPFLWSSVDPGDGQYQAVAAELGISVDAVKQALQRLKSAYGALLSRRLSAQGCGPAELLGEIRFMLDSLRATPGSTDV